MKRWLARLFGTREAGHPAAAPFGGAGNRPAAEDASLPDLDLDLAFFHWLAGPHVLGKPAPDGPVLDELARLARDPHDAAALVPRVPAVIPQLLRSLREDDTGAGALARQVAQDPVLVAEVIREVNSPYYQPASPIRNLEGAVLLLGQNGLRMLLARVAFRPIISQQAGPLARLIAPPLWRQSELCAQAAGLLAPRNKADPFEAYLAGLLHNVGLVVAFRVVEQLLPPGALPDGDAFGSRLVAAARLISARIADAWELPPPIGHAIAHLGDAGALPTLLQDADRLAKLQMLARGGQPLFVRAVLALPPEARRVYDSLIEQSDRQDA
ncbi:HDOD domain-containing protein [Massilia sp. CFBP9026]|uniref:HDOD domain-containing protein n=1 Tax=Massilia sp. CFBP9026 TaxID=3096536 RepID=UPI002A6B7D6C|nr:HDOD domain-containing protein [Massilia sp. CFBP9026]MDY0964150.1 HDOD domain-containing protein [Massilia sp. CFBP9026]